jgi:phosphopantetheinyl transferase (holo-ACP synthase)
MSDDGVVASGLEVVEIAEADRLLAEGEAGPFSAAERAYAQAKRDPARRLAARLAAKRAAAALLGAGVAPADVEVLRGRYGPPRLAFSDAGQRRLAELGASRALVSLTHGLEHAAASVLLLRDP